MLLVGFELEPEGGERKAMNEFFLIRMLAQQGWYDWHLEGFAECDLCSGDEEAGEGRGEERV